MPARPSRRSVLRGVGGTVAVAGLSTAAGCLGGDDASDDTNADFLTIVNGNAAERTLSVLVRQSGDRVVGGQYRLPGATTVVLDHAFEWGTYTVHGRLDDDLPNWQSWTWEPRSCARGDYQNDDGRWTGRLSAGDDGLEFTHADCPDEVAGFGGGGGADRPEQAGQYRVGDVQGTPTG